MDLPDEILTQDLDDTKPRFYYILEKVTEEKTLLIDDGSELEVRWWDRNITANWQEGDRIKISYQSANSDANPLKIENVDRTAFVWGSYKYGPEELEVIARVPNGMDDPDAYRKLVMHSGLVFKSAPNKLFASWKVGHELYIFHSMDEDSLYDLFNLTLREWSLNCSLVGHEKFQDYDPLVFEDVLTLNTRLDQHVLAQTEATETVTCAIWNYSSGLKDPAKPIGVFLFLGPTGVGKTEFAKALAKELFKDTESISRFDMSQFIEPHSMARLIGSPPGYVNHEEGGQLTNAIRDNPQSIVLLDEMEKAASEVRKIFLPVFDEGYIVDSKNNTYQCNNILFIMTSNLASEKIQSLFKKGYSSQEVLAAIEQDVIRELSPELYNRVTPILFRPLSQETISKLVELLLEKLVQTVKKTKDIDLTIDISVKDYLIAHGYHPVLGARPLKKLIEKKVTATLSYAIIKDTIPNGCRMSIAYMPESDAWHVEWSVK